MINVALESFNTSAEVLNMADNMAETPKRQKIISEIYNVHIHSQTDDIQQLRGGILRFNISLMVKLLMYNDLSVYNNGLDIGRILFLNSETLPLQTFISGYCSPHV